MPRDRDRTRDGRGPKGARGARRFRLAPPGADIELEHRIGTRSERIWAIFGVAVAAVLGIGNVLYGHPALSLIVLGIAAIGAVSMLSGPRRGVVALDGEALEIGPIDRARRIPIDDVLGTSRSAEPSVFADGRESWCVSYVDRSGEPHRPALAVALLEPAEADELDRRLAIRIRARQHDDPRALEALEAHLEAGEGAIGARLSGKRWRAFHSVDELRELAAHPFREGAPTIPVCVRSDVWDALRSASPELAGRLEPVVVLS